MNRLNERRLEQALCSLFLLYFIWLKFISLLNRLFLVILFSFSLSHVSRRIFFYSYYFHFLMVWHNLSLQIIDDEWMNDLEREKRRKRSKRRRLDLGQWRVTGVTNNLLCHLRILFLRDIEVKRKHIFKDKSVCLQKCLTGITIALAKVKQINFLYVMSLFSDEFNDFIIIHFFINKYEPLTDFNALAPCDNSNYFFFLLS